MAAAVSGLSPVIITVLIPMRRNSAKRSLIPPLTMSFRLITPNACPHSATTKRRAAAPGDVSDRLLQFERYDATMLIDELLDGSRLPLCELDACRDPRR